MNDERIQRIIEDNYDKSKEEGLRSMVTDFYSRELRSSAVAAWVCGIVCVAVAMFGAVQFFKADETKGQIMYASVFMLGALGVVMMKIFSWLMIYRHGIRRDIKRLELRIVELSEALKTK
jgi:hypothetical protein